MMTDRSRHPIVHFVGSIPLPDSETVFRTLSKACGPHLTRLPDGETGIRKSWIRFLQDVLSGNSAIEFAKDVPPFKFNVPVPNGPLVTLPAAPVLLVPIESMPLVNVVPPL